MKNQIIKIIKEKNGYITNKICKENKIHTIYLTRMVEENILINVKRGIYVHVEYLIDDFYTLHLKYSRLVYSRRTALYLNGLSNYRLEVLDANFPKTYNTSKISNDINSFNVNDNLYNTGICFITTDCGNKVLSYDKERCICDLFLFDIYSKEEMKYALNEYKKTGINYDKIYEYANVLKIYGKIKNILEVL